MSFLNFSLIDFMPVIMAAVVSTLGLGLVKLLVYLNRRESRLRMGRGRR